MAPGQRFFDAFLLCEQLVADDERARAYKAALKLAANDNVRLYGDLPA